MGILDNIQLNPGNTYEIKEQGPTEVVLIASDQPVQDSFDHSPLPPLPAPSFIRGLIRLAPWGLREHIEFYENFGSPYIYGDMAEDSLKAGDSSKACSYYGNAAMKASSRSEKIEFLLRRADLENPESNFTQESQRSAVWYDYDTWENRGKYHLERGAWEGARLAYRQALADVPSASDLQVAYGYNPEEASGVLRKELGWQPKHLFEFGWAEAEARVALLRGEYVKAVNILRWLTGTYDVPDNAGEWYAEACRNVQRRLEGPLRGAEAGMIRQRISSGTVNPAEIDTILTRAMEHVGRGTEAFGVSDWSISLDFDQIREQLDLALRLCESVERAPLNLQQRFTVLSIYLLRGALSDIQTDGYNPNDADRLHFRELVKRWGLETNFPETPPLDYYEHRWTTDDNPLSDAEKDLLANLARVRDWWKQARSSRSPAIEVIVEGGASSGGELVVRAPEFPTEPEAMIDALLAEEPLPLRQSPPLVRRPVLPPGSFRVAAGACFWGALLSGGKEVMDYFGIGESAQEVIFNMVNGGGLWLMVASSPEIVPALPFAIPGALLGSWLLPKLWDYQNANFHGGVIGGTASFIPSYMALKNYTPVLTWCGKQSLVKGVSLLARNPIAIRLGLVGLAAYGLVKVSRNLDI